jgi:hypothetical protein
MHFTSGSSVATVQSDWNTAVVAAWNTITNPIKVLYPAGTVLETTKTEQLTVVSVGGTPPVNKIRAVAISTSNPAIAGTSANPAMNDQDALLVSLRGTTPGRTGRGRIHLPAPDRTLVTASEVDATTATHVSTAINGVLSAMSASGHTAVVVNYTVTSTGTAVGTTTQVTTAETDRVLRSARIRSKGRKAVYV